MDKAIRNASPGAEGSRISVEDQTHKLARVYLLAGWVVLAVVAVIIGLIYRTIAVSRVTTAVESQNIAFAQRFTNTTWPEFSPFVNDAHDMRVEELREHAEIAKLGQAILAQVGDLPVVRITLYAKEGTIVFSTEPEETGPYLTRGVVREMVSGQWYWRRGSPAITELTHHETFKALDGELLDRDLVASLVPIPTDGRRLEALLQITQDVTPEMQRITRVQMSGIGSVILISTGLLAGTLFLMDRRKVR
jgi:hypothetical protein